MTPEERQQRAATVIDFRYSVIADLLNPYLARADRRRLIRQKATLQYQIPYRAKRRITASCITKWYKAFSTRGRAGLAPKGRSDSGICRSLPPEQIAAVLEELESDSSLTARAVCVKLLAEGVLSRLPSKSTLSRLVTVSGLTRAQRRASLQTTAQQLKFAFSAPLECVQADMMHAFPVPDGKNGHRKAILLCLLDDATRRVVYGSFSFRETSLEFEYGVRHVLLSCGRIGKLFCDNGSPFISSETRRILSILGIPLIHSRVGAPQSRGKIERFFRSLRDQFLRPLDRDSIKSIEDLNTRFHTWLESDYHRAPHRGLSGKTPLEQWCEEAHHIISLSPTVNLDEVFMHESIRRVYNDCTFTVDRVLYEVPSVLKGKNIKIRFNPFLPAPKLEVLLGTTSYGVARRVDLYANTRVKRQRIDDLETDGDDTRAPTVTPPPPPTLSPTRAALSASLLDLEAGETS